MIAEKIADEMALADEDDLALMMNLGRGVGAGHRRSPRRDTVDSPAMMEQKPIPTKTQGSNSSLANCETAVGADSAPDSTEANGPAKTPAADSATSSPGRAARESETRRIVWEALV